MNEQQITYFMALVEKQSFSKAAKSLYVTQPSFSQYIQKMEKQFGTKLFDRSSTPIRLTPEGEAVYEAVCEIRSIHANLKERITSLTNLQTGSLCIGTTPLCGSTLLSKSIHEFHKRYTGIHISLVEKPLNELQASIHNGECDIAICSGQISPVNFHLEILATEQIYLALSPDNPLTETLCSYQLQAEDIIKNSLALLKTPCCPLETFQKQPYVLFEGSESIASCAKNIFEEACIEPNVSLQVRNMHTAFAFVLADMGFSFFPDTMIKYGNFKKHPCYYKIQNRFNEQTIYLITKKNRNIPKTAIEYCLLLKELIVSGTWKK
ncbi:LysR family transcriptional regulator [Anaeromicropila populeti]|uniref:DNA-binding transcriptional regulator, LysR family n=1 Tax=Anaeromicropila populeti TaxID=37658 RepID=A0A1I6LP55_9FIRM|nr:LysR family transcriptional regulator [Anaeromicropila populeti]SFS05042.1 DNA-binding transcriptional regulator, LysR family [Anaeromicropila populeti]